MAKSTITFEDTEDGVSMSIDESTKKQWEPGGSTDAQNFALQCFLSFSHHVLKQREKKARG